MQKSIHISKVLNDKLVDYSIKDRRNQSDVISIALESHLLKEVKIEDMTETEAKKMYDALTDKKQQLEEQIQRVYLRLED